MLFLTLLVCEKQHTVLSQMNYSAGKLSEILGVKPEQLRDWRRRGFLGKIGTDVRGRWEYSEADMIVLSLAQVFRQRTGDLERAVSISLLSLSFFAARKRGESASRFLFFYEKESESEDRVMGFVQSTDASDLVRQLEGNPQAVIGILVDVDRVLGLLSSEVSNLPMAKVEDLILPFQEEANKIVSRNG